MQKSRGVAGLAGQRQNWTPQPQVFESFRRNLMIAIRGLKKQQSIGLSGVSQRLAIRQRREKMHDIVNAGLAKHVGIKRLIAAGAQINRQRLRRDAALGLEPRDRAEKWPRITLGRIQQAEMQKAQWPIGGSIRRRRFRDVLEIVFIVSVRHENALVSGQRGISLAINPDGRSSSEKYARGVANYASL